MAVAAVAAADAVAASEAAADAAVAAAVAAASPGDVVSGLAERQRFDDGDDLSRLGHAWPSLFRLVLPVSCSGECGAIAQVSFFEP